MSESGVRRRDFIKGAVALGAGWAILPRLARAGHEPGGSWLAGDLHCHTIYSGDVWSPVGDDNTGPDEFYTLGWTAREQILNAEVRGLDFLAITDHNDVRWMTPEDGAFTGYTGPLTLVPGYEHSMRRGHAGCLGITNQFTVDTSTDGGAVKLRDDVRAAGGLFILNHPFYKGHPPTGADGTPAWGYSTSLVVPDSVEVWNIGWPYRKPLFQGVSTSENYLSLPWWDAEFPGKGARVPATGGSDNHWRSTTAVQGVGQPTTWVYATGTTYQDVLNGIRAGRTTVSAQPPALRGAQLFLEATSTFGHWIIGDVVPPDSGDVTVTARVLNGAGHLLRFSVDGTYPDPPIPVTTPNFSASPTLPSRPSSRVRAELFLEPGFWMAALTSPIYFG